MSTPAKLLLAIGLPAAVLLWIANRPGVSAHDEVVEADVPVTETAHKPHADMDGGSADPHKSLSPEILYDIALRHANEGKFDAAINHLNDAIAQEPGNPILYAARSQSYLGLDDRSSALRDVERAVTLAEESDETDVLVGMLANRSQIYRQFNREVEALADLDRALELDKNYVPALFNRSHIYLNQNMTNEAVADLTRAILLQPEMATPYFNRAMAYETLGDMEKARADMIQFLELTRSGDHQDLAHEILKGWKEGEK